MCGARSAYIESVHKAQRLRPAGDAARAPLTSFRKTRVIRTVPFLRAAFAMKNPRATRDPSTIVNRTVTPRRPCNAELREREYLTPKEVDRLQDAARKHSRYGHRDATELRSDRFDGFWKD